VKLRVYLYENKDGTLLATSQLHEDLRLLDIAVVKFNNKLGEWVSERQNIDVLEESNG